MTSPTSVFNPLIIYLVILGVLMMIFTSLRIPRIARIRNCVIILLPPFMLIAGLLIIALDYPGKILGPLDLPLGISLLFGVIFSLRSIRLTGRFARIWGLVFLIGESTLLFLYLKLHILCVFF